MIESVSTDAPVLASTMNQVIDNVNSSPGRAVFTVNGSWTVPSGVHKFKVTMCGGGGRGGEGYSYFGGESGGGGTWNGGPGGDSPMISAVIAGQAVGATFAVTVGAAGHGALGSPPNTAAGSSSFGSLMSVAGGGVGGNAAMSTEGSKGSLGSASFPPGAPAVYHANGLFSYPSGTALIGYGTGAAPSFWGGDGSPGIVVVEW